MNRADYVRRLWNAKTALEISRILSDYDNDKAIAETTCPHNYKKESGHGSGYPFSPIRCTKCGYEP